MSYWYRDGQPIDSIPVTSRAFQYGDGLFETVAIRDGEARLWDLHVERLQDSCARLGLPAPSAEKLGGALRTALEDANGQADIDTDYCVAKIVLSAAPTARGYSRTASADTDLLVGVFAASRPDASRLASGVITRRCVIPVAQQPALAGIKSLNRLEQVLARAEWDNPEIFDGLMCDADDNLICGTMSNVFAYRNNAWTTPRLDRGGVAGVMRRHILDVLRENGRPCAVEAISFEKFLAADEVFLCNSQFGVLPVVSCESSQWSVGPETQNVCTLLAQSGVEECSA